MGMTIYFEASNLLTIIQFWISGSNKKERRRTQSINNAFSSLRDCIPNVPCDTKLSKIKTLRLATSYIDYLMQMLNSENVTSNAITGFKADIHKRWKEKSEEQKRRELVRTIFFFFWPITVSCYKNTKDRVDLQALCKYYT